MMMRKQRSAGLLLLFVAGLFCRVTIAIAADPATQPDIRTSGPATAPAAACDPAVAKILDRLEKKGAKVKALEAAIKFTRIDPVLEDKQVHKGVLRFKQTRPNPRFFIRFDELKLESLAPKKEKQWHVFDGRWYIEAREKTKSITKREIVRQGETLEIFKIGQGPFPLPFGQKKADVLKHFAVKLVASKPKDPKHSDHLECTPRAGTELADKYETVHFYIDQTLDLPVRVQTIEKEEGNEIIASFTKIKVNPGLPDSKLNLPDLKDYAIDTVPLKTSPQGQ